MTKLSQNNNFAKLPSAKWSFFAAIYYFFSDFNLKASLQNGHVAALLGVKVLTIWGLTHPYAGFSPYGQSKENNILVDRSLFPKIPTSIYGNKSPAGYDNAINTITTQEIINRVRELI